MPRPRVIVSLNCGSSSLKFAAYRIRPGEEERLMQGAAERIGQPGANLWARDRNGAMRMERTGEFATHSDVLGVLTTAFQSGELPSAEAVGHRVVHGGPDHVEPAGGQAYPGFSGDSRLGAGDERFDVPE